MLFWSLVFIGVSSYLSITDNNKSKNYFETEEKIVSYENCQYDDDGKEIHEFVVDNYPNIKGFTKKI